MTGEPQQDGVKIYLGNPEVGFGLVLGFNDLKQTSCNIERVRLVRKTSLADFFNGTLI